MVKQCARRLVILRSSAGFLLEDLGMYRLRALLATLALLAGIALPSSALPRGIPGRFDAAKSAGGPPLWVSVEEAAPSGKIRWDLFSNVQQQELRTKLSTPPPSKKAGEQQPTCAVESTTVGDYFSGNPSLGELVKNSAVIYSGKILSMQQGFYKGSPSTLLEVSVTQTYKAPDKFRAVDRIYVTYPAAKVNLEGKLICQRPERGYSDPALGGRILVFSFRDPTLTTDLPVVEPMDQELFFETASGESSVPSHFKRTGQAVPWDTIEQKLESVVKPHSL